MSYLDQSELAIKLPTALTFDDGPTRMVTLDLLSLLHSRGAKATFFLVGSRASNAPEIVSQIASQGHEIGNHSWSHSNFQCLTDKQLFVELKKTHDCVYEITGVAPKLLRPPYGVISEQQKRFAAQWFGYTTVMWNVDTNDWKRPGVSEVSSKIRSSLKNGSVVLLHDSHRETLDAVDIGTAGNPASEFVTVSSLRQIFSGMKGEK